MDYEAFKLEIQRLTDINLTLYKEKQMKRRIDSLIRKNSFENYFDYIKGLKTNNRLFNEFINYLTINVSEFYRNAEQWEVLQKDVIPLLIQKSRRLKVWSSACSTGDEPYTLVMVLNKFMPLGDIKIIATDIDGKAIEKAKAGIYNTRSLGRLPDEFRNKYFVKDGELYHIKDEVKKCVEYKKLNLLKDDYPKDCDLIVCRNVLIYFTEEAKDYVYKGFNRSLKTGGVLFVGSTEQIINTRSYNFNPVKMFFYMKEKALT